MGYLALLALRYLNNKQGGTMLPTGGRVLVVGVSKWLKNKFIRSNRPDVP